MDFLTNFSVRMKKIGAYALLIKNNGKGRWKDYGFDGFDEQINFLIIVLLFIMEETTEF